MFCRLLYLEFPPRFSPTLDLLCAWLQREKQGLRLIPPTCLDLLIVRLSFSPPHSLSFWFFHQAIFQIYIRDASHVGI